MGIPKTDSQTRAELRLDGEDDSLYSDGLDLEIDEEDDTLAGTRGTSSGIKP